MKNQINRNQIKSANEQVGQQHKATTGLGYCQVTRKETIELLPLLSNLLLDD